MSKRWLSSVDVEVSQGGSPLFGVSGCSSFVGGTKTCASANVAEKLVTNSTPCQFVWMGAKTNSTGQALNAYVCFVGDADNQNIPITPSNFEGLVIRLDDASKVYVRAANTTDGVVYRIFA